MHLLSKLLRLPNYLNKMFSRLLPLKNLSLLIKLLSLRKFQALQKKVTLLYKFTIIEIKTLC